MRSMVLLVVGMLMLMITLALLIGQASRHDRALERAASTPAPEATPLALELSLSLSPEEPTSADIVEVRIGKGSEVPEQALRVVGERAFFVEVLEVPTDTTYLLGALEPGRYTFSLFQRIPGTPFCSHKLLEELHFTVQPATPRGSGRLVLFLELEMGGGGADRVRVAARALVEEEGPQFRWLFGNVAVVHFTPGLEASYQELLRESPEVEAAKLNLIGFIPECPLPLGPAFAPGTLLVSFREGIEQKQAEALLRQLPPRLEAFQPLGEPAIPLGLARVRVPSGWELLFLQQYLQRPEVVAGWAIPQTASLQISQVGEGGEKVSEQ